MRDHRRTSRSIASALLLVCLGFTGRGVAWADPATSVTATTDSSAAGAEHGPPSDLEPVDPIAAAADPVPIPPPDTDTSTRPPPRPDLYIEDPYAPHRTNGDSVRVGTMVGFLYGLPQPVTELGAVAAAGKRFGRVTLEGEASYFWLETQGTYLTALGPTVGDVGVGHGERLGAIARFDVLRLDSHYMGQNSMFAVYVEGGGALEWEQFTAPVDAAGTLKPDNSRRTEGEVGFGIMLDHRLQEPSGYVPRRIGWFLGWRLAMSPHQDMTATECRSTSTMCERVAMPEPDSGTPVIDRSMLFQSSLQFTF